MSLPPGLQIGHYRILALLGSGGMGEVYRAHDARLGRDVAVKVLPPGYGADPDRLRRFEIEARALAALNHPNILAVFDVGTYEGAPFLVMELLEGENLRERLARSPLPRLEALGLALQMAHGLAAAHGKGLVHRDLKPANLFLTQGGTLKILDFGLAKQGLVSPSGSDDATRGLSSVTGAGLMLGTVGYMAPEQISGAPADARSDIFGFGVVLYELLSGTRPFQRTSAIETLHATLVEDPPELSSASGPVPPSLQRLVGHCLEKDPARRFQHVQDLVYDLEAELGQHPSAGAATGRMPFPRRRSRRLLPAGGLLVSLGLLAGLLVWSPWKSQAPPFDPRCVAILPFENLTGDPSLDSLGRQAVDLVRQDLQAVADLKVAADPGLPQGRGTPERRLAEAARARTVASGTFYLKGGEVELQARVVDPWAGKAIYTLGPWRVLRNDPAKAMEAMRSSLCGAVAWSFYFTWWDPGSSRPPNLGAFLAFQKAETSPGDFNPRVEGYEKALALDPDFLCPGYILTELCCLSDCYDKGEKVLKDLEARAERAPAVDKLWTVHLRAYLERRPSQMLQAIDQILVSQPATPFLHSKRAEAELNLNRIQAAITDLKAMPRSEPHRSTLTLSPEATLCRAYHLAGDHRTELQEARHLQVLFPDDFSTIREEIIALAALGRAAEIQKRLEAIAELRKDSGQAFLAGTRGVAAKELWAHGYREEARRLAEANDRELAQVSPDQEGALPMIRVQALEILGRWPEALPFRRALAAKPYDGLDLKSHYKGLLACLLIQMGRSEEARQLEAEIAAMSGNYLFGNATYHRAGIAAQLGEKDRALALLREAMAEGFSFDNRELHLDYFFDPLHGYPPFEAFMKPRN